MLLGAESMLLAQRSRLGGFSGSEASGLCTQSPCGQSSGLGAAGLFALGPQCPCVSVQSAEGHRQALRCPHGPLWTLTAQGARLAASSVHCRPSIPDPHVLLRSSHFPSRLREPSALIKQDF